MNLLSEPQKIVNHYKKYYIQYEQSNYDNFYCYVLDNLLYDLDSKDFKRGVNVYDLDTIIRTLLSLLLYRFEEKEELK